MSKQAIKKKAERRVDEKELLYSDPRLLDLLLLDRSTKKNIIWATNDYSTLGEEFSFYAPITSKQLLENPSLIIPRSQKALENQIQRSKAKAEVFTPSWVCNKQNNQIDNAWFGKATNRFNKELICGWESTYSRKDPNDFRDRIKFPTKTGKTWKDYVLDTRIEISCGEAPYLTSRYDTVTGKFIRPKNRIGLLDRKLRVITENTSIAPLWLNWAEKALQSTYGFEWQGDNVFLARKNILLSIIEYYECLYHTILKPERIYKFAEIISWNIWQMDGIKFVVPNSCHEINESKLTLLGDVVSSRPCPGCKTGNNKHHTGVYSLIKDWKADTIVQFIETMEDYSL